MRLLRDALDGVPIPVPGHNIPNLGKIVEYGHRNGDSCTINHMAVAN